MLARIGRAARDDQLGLVPRAQLFDLVVVDQLVLATHAVVHRLEPLAGHRWPGAVRQVAARIQVDMPSKVSPGCSSASITAPLACAPECGCTLAKPA